MDFDKLSEGHEARSVPFKDMDTSRDGKTFVGYAAVFDNEADLGDFTESITRGAFRKALDAGTNVPMLLDHNRGMPPLATTQGGTLRLKEDARGLLVEADIANHYVGDALREMINRGDVKGMSFGFIAGRGNSKVEDRGGKPHRNLLGFRALTDVSPTWNPAYPSTEAGFRSLFAVQMADSLEAAQRILDGSYPRVEDGALPSGTGTEESVTEPEGTKPDGTEQEQRAGAESAEVEAAARRRRLQMWGMTLPR